MLSQHYVGHRLTTLYTTECYMTGRFRLCWGFMRLLPKLEIMTWEERLKKLFALTQRQLRGDFIDMYKIK